MKLTIFLLTAAFLQVHAASTAQSVTISGKDITLRQVFAAIETQTGYVLFANESDFSQAKRISLSVFDFPLNDLLELILKDQPFDYSIKGETIILSRKSAVSSSQVVSSDLPVTPLAPPPITGIVYGPDGQPLAGVNVVVKGTKRGVVTDAQGKFSIEVNKDDVLVFSSIGYDKVEISVKEKGIIHVQMNIAVKSLDELQVIAYGVTSQRYNLGNVATVKSSEIEKQPIQNPLLTLQGRVPGLIVTQQSGVVGGGVQVRVGTLQNSIKYGNDPLIIIDGVPYPSQMPRTGLENTIGSAASGQNPSPLNFINPGDIESIDILKDADATAIYGSRAANGAILITTKKGKAGQLKASIKVQYGMSKVTQRMDMMNTREYLDMRYEAFRNDGIDWKLSNVSANDLKLWDTTRYTDWQKELFGNAATFMDASVSLSGGTETSKFLVSTSFNRSSTVFPGDFSDLRGAAHFNLSSSSLNKKFSLQLSANYMVDDNRLPGVDLTATAIRLPPNAPAIYLSADSLNWATNNAGSSTWKNPLADVLYRKYTNNTNNLISNVTLSYTIIPRLVVKASFGYNRLQTEDLLLMPLLSVPPEQRPNTQRRASYGRRKMTAWIIEPHATYDITSKSHNFNLLVGSSIQQSIATSGSFIGVGYNSDDAMKNPAAATMLTSTHSISEYRYIGLFGRANYSYNKKYLLNFSLRRDGSSRFGAINRFKTFSSIAAGWVFTEENFGDKLFPYISFGKFRTSYGVTGSDQIGDYLFLSLYGNVAGAIPYQGVPGLMSNRLTNPYLQWEETRKFQVGLDLGLFRDVVVLNLTYNYNKSYKQLMSYILPSITGFTSVESNFPATVTNSGIEITVTTKNLDIEKFSWTTSINLTMPRNKLTAFPDIENSAYANSLVVGQPLNILRLWKFAGVDPILGQYTFYDSKGGITSSPDYFTDRVITKNLFPTIYGGMHNTFVYRQFQFDFLLQFNKQMAYSPVFDNGSGRPPGALTSDGTSGNMPRTLLNRWKNEGDIAQIQKFSTKDFSYSSILASDANCKDASYIRLKNISFSWETTDSKLRKLGLHSLKTFIQVQNLLTITKYKGLDPETLSISSLPPLRTITFGILIGF